jgi:diguanylate cyclase
MPENTSLLPTYTASPEQNSAYIRQMLPLMMKHNVPVDPMNYAIWYHYVAGTHGDLNEVIDALIRDQKPFDSDTTLHLYKTYICNASLELFEDINCNLQRLINQTTLSINATSEKASAADSSFNAKLTKLNAVENEENLKSILAEIIVETMQLSESSRILKDQLDITNKEMEQLRSELTYVREAANTDTLTGLLNRLAFDKALDELIESTATKSACLALLDIDHFKRVNDSYGHLVGDQVIRFVASLLKKYAAEHHRVARYGGEEMAVIMPDTTLAEAFKVIEQIRTVLDTSRLKHKSDAESLVKVTVSAGIASLQAADSAYTFTERADNALYHAKKTGRNKVVTDEQMI